MLYSIQMQSVLGLQAVFVILKVQNHILFKSNNKLAGVNRTIQSFYQSYSQVLAGIIYKKADKILTIQNHIIRFLVNNKENIFQKNKEKLTQMLVLRCSMLQCLMKLMKAPQFLNVRATLHPFRMVQNLFQFKILLKNICRSLGAYPKV